MPRIVRIAILFILIGLATASVPAQQAPERDNLIVTTNLGTVNVIVTDKNGRYVRGLKPEQFSLYDQDGKQNIQHFSAGAVTRLGLRVSS